MKIYSLKDRISVDIDGVVFKLSPLSYKQKIEIQSMMLNGNESDGVITCIKYCLKEVSGIEDVHGNEYKLSLIDGCLTEDCLDEILNIENSLKLQISCLALLSGIPKEIINPANGLPVDGVKIIDPKLKGKSKKGTSR